MAAVRTTMDEARHDPFMATFDRGVALTAYGLLLISPLMLGVPAVVALAMAFAHRDDPHSLTRSHYRFQVRIFWTTVVCLVLGAALAIGAGGLAIGSAYHFMRESFPALSLPEGGWQGIGNLQQEEGWLLLAGAAFLSGSLIYILASSLYGLTKLLAGRPIRLRNA